MLKKLDWLRAKLKTPPFKPLNAMTFKHSQSIPRFYWLLTPQGVCRITATSKEATQVRHFPAEFSRSSPSF
jgi:hypothetical protein